MCGVCKQLGHNKVTCLQGQRPQVERPTKLNVKERKITGNDKGEVGEGNKGAKPNGEGAEAGGAGHCGSK